MPLTAALRSVLIALIARGITWVATTLDVALDVNAISDALGTALWVFLSGVVAYAVNKLGSKYAWINLLLSFGRAKSSAVYIPSDQKAVVATETPSGVDTSVVTVDNDGTLTKEN